MWSLPSADRDADRVSRAARLFSSAKRRALVAHKKPVDCLAWSVPGTRLASASRDASIRIWSFDARRDIGGGAGAQQQQHQQQQQHHPQQFESIELKGHTDDVARVSWHPQQHELLASCSQDKTVKLWDTRGSGRLLYSMHTLGPNLHLKWSPCGRFLLLLNSNNLVSLIAWDPATHKLSVIKSFGFTLDINDMEWAAGSERAVLGHQNGSLEVVSVPGLTKVASIPAHGSTVFALAMDPRGKLLATGAADSLVHLWSVEDMVCVRSLGRLDDSIRTLSFNADSSLLAYGGKDLKMELADVASGARVALWETSDEVLSIAFHPTLPGLLAFATGDKTRNIGEIHIVAAPFGANITTSSNTSGTSSGSGSTSSNNSSHHAAASASNGSGSGAASLSKSSSHSNLPAVKTEPSRPSSATHNSNNNSSSNNNKANNASAASSAAMTN